MDLNRDELRRALKAIDDDNKAAMPKWYAALRQIIAGGTTMSTDEKAALLGVPSPGRRQLFKIGGATIMGAAVLAACSNDDDGGGGETASDGGGGEGDGSTTTAAPDPVADAPLVRTAASLEKLAVDTYQTAIDTGLLTTPAIASAATLFQSHHQEHLDALNAAVKDLDGEEVTEPNEAVYRALIQPGVAAAATEADLVTIALALENAAAETYVFAGGALTDPALRSTIMTIGGIEARHAAVLQIAGLAASPPAVFPGERAVFPDDNPLADIDGAILST